jgi:hypothetical protein
MATGTVRVIGNIMATQRPLDEHYLNEGVAWVDTAAVLAGVPLGSRSPGKLIDIAGVLYWFEDDKTTLSTVFAAALPIASQVTIADAGSLFTDPGTGKQVEAALAEVKTQANATDATIAGMGTGTLQTCFRIDLVTASGSVAARVAGATETTDYPTGWTLAANATVNLLVTHTLTGRKLSSVNIFEIDGANERLLKPFESAFSGVLCNGLTVLIEGLAPVALALRIELIFN